MPFTILIGVVLSSGLQYSVVGFIMRISFRLPHLETSEGVCWIRSFGRIFTYRAFGYGFNACMLGRRSRQIMWMINIEYKKTLQLLTILLKNALKYVCAPHY